jgi:hypothetical protein
VRSHAASRYISPAIRSEWRAAMEESSSPATECPSSTGARVGEPPARGVHRPPTRPQCSRTWAWWTYRKPRRVTAIEVIPVGQLPSEPIIYVGGFT